MNNQPKEKAEYFPNGSLEVHHLFHSIQGEGPFVGKAAVFIRLTGCNLECPACDEEYTSKRTRLTPKAISEYIKDTFLPVELIVITGGEPFRQNILPVIDLLHSEGYTVQIETNGSINPLRHLSKAPVLKARSIRILSNVVIVCSPKTGSIKLESKYIDAYKYVVEAGKIDLVDGLPLVSLDHPNNGAVAKPHSLTDPSRIYIQPMDSKHRGQNDLNMKEALASVFKFNYKMCLQVHKLMNLE